jgi:hypothetical protein
MTRAPLHRHCAPLCALLATLFLGPGGTPLAAATVVLDDGRELIGRIVSEDSRTLVLAISSGSMELQVSHPLRTIIAIDRELAPQELRQQDWQQQRAEAAQQGDADAMWSLAIEAAAAGNPLAHRRFARATLAIDPDHAGANRALGNVLHDGTWMGHAEAQRAKGLLYYDNQWLTAEEIALRREDDEQRREAAAQQRAERRRAAAASIVRPQPLGGVFRSSSAYSSYRGFPLLPLRFHYRHGHNHVEVKTPYLID